ncbi:HAMP domain-containing histidine kinase [Salinibacterium sp. NSLL150]|uniref:HAMP domain-containing sensor histidine kinase n=1 Tax=unclassified Salinibacterium TaxID=2632331 RepID=UPI0018CECA76|nr:MULTISPECIES: HAMP domain-containing sensor histidine kinase [unclassified Salinibacterium]MBH0098069.1 HAMP domain-containing histidine kinase [Salinibacterium sp. NSLL35]MBH0100824.1 HAMP domain-containing histidine kinase [Salinibacterium sp. NSLL150]MBH0103583.1 HAMP domain-containing histidine kinase [Salinibacterium sp. NSLL16]MBH0106344.1 HAMP domain-containing histidine kinase [Salinibacterium sp. NSLL17]MBH0109883.1 HAMP domain-containing histidine kinase [Salinibacterium sp. NG22]
MTRTSGLNLWGFGALGTRILLAFLAVAISTVLVLAGAALIGVDRGVQAGEQADRQEVADAIAATAAESFQRAGSWDAADLSRAVRIGEAASARLVILDLAGTTVVSSGIPNENSPGGGGALSSSASVADVTVDDAVVGTVRVALSTASSSRVLDIAWAWIVIAAFAALAIAFTASWVVTRFLVGPLHRVTDAARAFTAGDRTSRVDGRAPGELGELAVAFNGMADEVARSERDRRNLTADVAHELRTPLAALQAGLEELRDGLVVPDAERLAALHDQSLRLGRIVADLAELAAAETAGALPHESRVDLAQISQEEVALHDAQLRAAGLHVITNLPEPVFVQGDADRLHQAVGNVIANAVRYCRDDDSLTVALAVQGDDAVLTISDTGPGIPVDDLPYVFDRLWRGTAARDISGSGIGLAVVREVVDQHGGSAEVESAVGEGTRIIIRLPLATA